MDLLQNPFNILNATSRDNRRRIMELADERSLMLDSSECTQARSDLTNPRKRLSAEVAWLPGIGPKRAVEVLALIELSPPKLLGIDKLTSVARANLLAAGLSRLPDCSSDDIAEWILEISWTFEDIDPEELSAILNEERIVSGFPEITDLSAVETEIQERRHHYQQVIKAALNNLSAKNRVKAVTIAVESATDVGEDQGPILLDDLVDSYEIEIQTLLEKEEGNIKVLIEKIQTAIDAERPDSTIAPMINQLIQVVKNWDTVAQPIQVSAKSRGLDHDASHRVAKLVRGMAIDLFNKHGKLNFSQQITNMLQEVFAEVGEVAERTAEDAEALGEIAKKQNSLIKEAEKRDKEWRREITYEGSVGVVFKEELRISPNGIEWKGKIWPLDSITRVRWGTTTISTRSRYSSFSSTSKTIDKIQFGNNSGLATVTIETSFSLTSSVVGAIAGKAKNPIIFDKFIDCLWKAVCVRILETYIKGFKEGKDYKFGSTVVQDSGIELMKQGFFSGGKKVFCRWGEIDTLNENGKFYIKKRHNHKFAATFSYQAEDNIHILAAIVNLVKKYDKERLSEILD